MAHTCRICSPYVPGLTHADTAREASDEAASAERVDNLRITPMRAGSGRTRAAVERMKLWQNGRTLRVRFLDGRPEVQPALNFGSHSWLPASR